VAVARLILGVRLGSSQQQWIDVVRVDFGVGGRSGGLCRNDAERRAYVELFIERSGGVVE